MGGIYNNFIIPIVRGWNIVVPLGSKTGVLTNAWNYVLRYQVSIIWLVPSIVGILNRLGSSELTKQAALYVQYALSGTSQLSVVERENFFKLFGVDLLDNYSLSETLFISTDLPGIHGSVRGALMPYVDCCISQDSEVCVKSPYLLERYFHIDNSDASLVDNDDFFCTGDLGSLDLNRLTFTGRKKDLIIKGGVNISPAYIEEKFHEFSEISELTVVGVPDKYAGEIVVLYYVSEYNITEKIIEFSRANFSGPYIPDRTVRVDKLPKTSSGKIKKSTLRDKCNHV